MTSLQEAVNACAHASAAVKTIVDRASDWDPETPRTEEVELDLRAQIGLALANLRTTNTILDEVLEREGGKWLKH